MLNVAVPKEILAGETRVAATPDTVAKMVKAGVAVAVEAGAGLLAYIDDAAYVEAGARIESNTQQLFKDADIILKVQPPHMNEALKKHEIDLMNDGATLIGPFAPLQNKEICKQLNAKKLTSFSMDMIPRIARAQAMDILSSMSSIAGYKAVILAADHLKKLFPMMTTAAGTIPPAKVLVIGAGVAGLQAIATARRLGGAVIAFDTRPAAAEQVKSLGADFVCMDIQHATEDKGGYALEQSEEFYKAEQELLQKYILEADVVITTALIPGKRAPILITEQMVKSMRKGSVIVDLAIEQKGNCTLSEPEKIVIKNGVTVIGLFNIPSLLPVHASQFYAKNILNFVNYMLPQLQDRTFDLNDDLIKGCLITHQGETVHPLIK